MPDNFSVNQKVIHCREGLSRIVSEAKIGGNEYFVIQSESGAGENIYVLKSRTQNIIRPIMTLEEAKKLIDFMASVKPEFMANTKQRRDFYKKKLGSGSVHDLAYLSRQLFLFHYLNDNGTLVKLGPTDVEMLETADRILFDEFALAFNQDTTSVREYIIKLIA